LSGHSDKLTGDGHQRLVRHGYLPEREIMTGTGPVAVRCPRVRDRIGEFSRAVAISRGAVFWPPLLGSKYPPAEPGFSFGAAQSGLSVSLQSGVPPLCECLTKCRTAAAW